MSTKFNYTKPSLQVLSEGTGLIEAINLRPSLIEQLNTPEEWVAHVISLEDKDMLIFSINGAGKSTLLIARWVNVILAQAAMYGATLSFNLRPYHDLLTRN